MATFRYRYTGDQLIHLLTIGASLEHEETVEAEDAIHHPDFERIDASKTTSKRKEGKDALPTPQPIMSAGGLSRIRFSLESAWGTAVTPNKSIVVKPGDGVRTDTDLRLVSSIKAQLARNASSCDGAATPEGEYELELIPSVAGYLLKSAFGGLSSVVKAAPKAAVYDQSFTEAATRCASSRPRGSRFLLG